MNENISLAFSANPTSTSAVLTVAPEGGDQISLPISSVTGGEDEAALFAAITAAITAYRAVKGF